MSTSCDRVGWLILYFSAARGQWRLSVPKKYEAAASGKYSLNKARQTTIYFNSSKLWDLKWQLFLSQNQNQSLHNQAARLSSTFALLLPDVTAKLCDVALQCQPVDSSVPVWTTADRRKKDWFSSGRSASWMHRLEANKVSPPMKRCLEDNSVLQHRKQSEVRERGRETFVHLNSLSHQESSVTKAAGFHAELSCISWTLSLIFLSSKKSCSC